MIRFIDDLEDRFAALADERRGTVRGVMAVCLRDLFACLGEMARARPDPYRSRSSRMPMGRE